MFKFSSICLIAIMSTVMVTHAQARSRSFVSSYGNDANPCGPFAPCRQFDRAIDVTDPDGEVVVLDSTGFLPVTISKSVSLTAPTGVYAAISVSAAGTSGVTIATPGVSVVLRGLTINGLGGDSGILMTAGAKLSIENCVISNFSIIGSSSNQLGVLVQTPATVRMVNTLIRDNDIGIQLQEGATADISESKFLGNSTAGIFAFNETAGTTTTAAISNTIVLGSGIGIYARVITPTASSKIDISRSIVSSSGVGITAESPASVGAASVSIRKSMVTGSSNFGLWNIDGTLISYGNNTLSNNSVNVVGTLTTVAPL
ncbi:Right handed beta helix region [Candidatus Nitrotoga sp. BS]|uniref:right-handed parallel beta-helix repeat-containing protein n=1 Tax=Candidatus Nitrotoga sp. BS TaxID=2890408 RepID=UPI001EF38EC1|nr:right-handed parallel beta-helix repeat-containing protein [Candidatus Nitrotoga sp. BS]CAH1193066.1 Right handed beta helix region [Candidatus Nitrotoga sp. BS]